MENNYDKILHYFTENSGRNDRFSAPRPQGEYVYATDERIAIRMPKKLISGTYCEHETQPNFESIFHPEKMDNIVFFEEIKKIVLDNKKKTTF